MHPIRPPMVKVRIRDLSCT